MSTSLGIDVGTNSVSSAWVDFDNKSVCLGVSVFPAGVEKREDKLGSPLNHKRRQMRSMRRSVRRKAQRKKLLHSILEKHDLLPGDGAHFDHEVRAQTPWQLRRDGLQRVLTPHEFGRTLLHMAQRRGRARSSFGRRAGRWQSEGRNSCVKSGPWRPDGWCFHGGPL